jgi:hypothetical protein
MNIKALSGTCWRELNADAQGAHNIANVPWFVKEVRRDEHGE